MDKRSFLKSVGIAMAGCTIGATQAVKAAELLKPTVNKLLKPKILKKGDTLGLITPAGALTDEESITMTREVFEKLGFIVKEGKYIRARYGNLAGTDEQRIEDIHAMFADPTIAGIVCIRGGNGASRLLDRLDYKLVAQNPKVLLGYSDVTALILAFYAKTGLVSFHGAVGTSTWTNQLAKAFEEQFFANKLQEYQNPVAEADNFIRYSNRIQTITPGIVEGPLIGGNLTLLSGLCGSDYLPDFKGAILFLEEVGEGMERMDRMFCQLKNSGILKQIKGFVFGHCTDCTPASGYGSLTMQDILKDYIAPLGIPAYSGARIGHISNQFMLPVGITVRMDASQGRMLMLENALT